MADASGSFHEDPDQLSPATREQHRAIVSLMEELEAVDWYQQRVDACEDDELRAILAHNRDEEKEHAAMVLEWLRRRDREWDEQLRTYLFTDGPITELEPGDDVSADDGAPSSGLGIGSLREGSAS